jgi:hypothetical protein
LRQPQLAVVVAVDNALQEVRPFPQARGASQHSRDTVWTAEVDGVALLSADNPAPSLLLGDDWAEVLATAQRLGLR